MDHRLTTLTCILLAAAAPAAETNVIASRSDLLGGRVWPGEMAIYDHWSAHLLWLPFVTNSPDDYATSNGADDLTAYNSPVWTSDGYDFEEGDSDYLRGDLTLDYPFTIMAWVSHEQLNGGQTIISIASGVGNNYHSIMLAGGANRWACRAYNGSDQLSDGAVKASGWHHVAGVFASDSSRICVVDGEAAAEDTVQKTGIPFGSCTVGAAGDATINNYMDGLIDDARVYTNALTEAQISNIYERTKGAYGL